MTFSLSFLTETINGIDTTYYGNAIDQFFTIDNNNIPTFGPLADQQAIISVPANNNLIINEKYVLGVQACDAGTGNLCRVCEVTFDFTEDPVIAYDGGPFTLIPGGTEVRSDYFLYDVCGNRWWKSLVGQPPIPSSGFIQQQDLPTGTGIWCPVRVETKYAPVKMRFEYTIYTRGSREATITGDVSINALFYNGGYPGSPTTATAAINGVYDDQNGIRQVVDGSPPIVVPPFVGPTASSTSLLLPVQPNQIG